MNTSATSLEDLTITTSGLNWYQLQEIAWDCFPYVSVAYVVPFNCVFGFCENLNSFCASQFEERSWTFGASILRAAGHLQHTQSVYLSICKTLVKCSLRFATGGKFYFSATNYNIWMCRIFKNMFIPFSVVLMWTYVLLNVERMFAIAFPLKAKIFFNVRRNILYITAAGVLAVQLMIYSMYLQQIQPTPSVLGPLICVVSTPSLPNMIFYQIITNLAIFTLPPALNLVFGLLLVLSILRQHDAQKSLLNALSRSGHSPSSNAIRGGVVVVLMAILHSVINLPAGIFGCLYFV